MQRKLAVELKATLTREQRILDNRSTNKNAGTRPGRDRKAGSDVQGLRERISNREANYELSGSTAGSGVAGKAYDLSIGSNQEADK